MFDLTKPYKTKSGEKAFAMPGPRNRLYGWVEAPPGIDCLQAAEWDADGRWRGPGRGPYYEGNGSERDLVNTPAKRTVKVWLNMVDGADTMVVGGYRTREKAIRCQPSDAIACIEREISFDFGEGM